jgi:hypothetical protein
MCSQQPSTEERIGGVCSTISRVFNCPLVHRVSDISTLLQLRIEQMQSNANRTQSQVYIESTYLAFQLTHNWQLVFAFVSSRTTNPHLAWCLMSPRNNLYPLLRQAMWQKKDDMWIIENQRQSAILIRGREEHLANTHSRLVNAIYNQFPKQLRTMAFGLHRQTLSLSAESDRLAKEYIPIRKRCYYD